MLIEALRRAGPVEIPCALVRSHGPLCWGTSPGVAVQNAVILEELARMVLLTTLLDTKAHPLSEFVRDKHFQRKHGPAAYYGQR